MVITVGIVALITGLIGGFYLRGYIEGDVIDSLRTGLEQAEEYIDSLETKIVELTPKPKVKKTKAAE